jgi:hypothetical protein
MSAIGTRSPAGGGWSGAPSAPGGASGSLSRSTWRATSAKSCRTPGDVVAPREHHLLEVVRGHERHVVPPRQPPGRPQHGPRARARLPAPRRERGERLGRRHPLGEAGQVHPPLGQRRQRQHALPAPPRERERRLGREERHVGAERRGEREQLARARAPRGRARSGSAGRPRRRRCRRPGRRPPGPPSRPRSRRRPGHPVASANATAARYARFRSTGPSPPGGSAGPRQSSVRPATPGPTRTRTRSPRARRCMSVSSWW